VTPVWVLSILNGATSLMKSPASANRLMGPVLLDLASTRCLEGLGTYFWKRSKAVVCGVLRKIKC
jgi:hypothetical protein